MSFRLTKAILATIQPVIDVVTSDPSQLATPFVQAFIADHFEAFCSHVMTAIQLYRF